MQLPLTHLITTHYKLGHGIFKLSLHLIIFSHQVDVKAKTVLINLSIFITVAPQKRGTRFHYSAQIYFLFTDQLGLETASLGQRRQVYVPEGFTY